MGTNHLIVNEVLRVQEPSAKRLGLDRLDRGVLEALCRRFGGGPVGLSTLAVAVGEERETVEEVAEPFLVRQGFLARTPRGRVATRAAWHHLGLAAPATEEPTLTTSALRRFTSATISIPALLSTLRSNWNSTTASKSASRPIP